MVEGKTRAKQFYLEDNDRNRVVSVLIHGDAAFSGQVPHTHTFPGLLDSRFDDLDLSQGVVYETMGFSDLHDYTTGGTIRITFLVYISSLLL